MKQFKVVQCPKCTLVQVTQSLIRLGCKFCRKSSSIKSKRFGFTLPVIASFDLGREAACFVREYSRQVFERRNVYKERKL